MGPAAPPPPLPAPAPQTWQLGGHPSGAARGQQSRGQGAAGEDTDRPWDAGVRGLLLRRLLSQPAPQEAPRRTDPWSRGEGAQQQAGRARARRVWDQRVKVSGQGAGSGRKHPPSGPNSLHSRGEGGACKTYMPPGGPHVVSTTPGGILGCGVCGHRGAGWIGGMWAPRDREHVQGTKHTEVWLGAHCRACWSTGVHTARHAGIWAVSTCWTH